MSSKYEAYKRNSVVNPAYAESYDRIFGKKITKKKSISKKEIQEEKRQRRHQKKLAKNQAKKDRINLKRSERLSVDIVDNVLKRSKERIERNILYVKSQA